MDRKEEEEAAAVVEKKVEAVVMDLWGVAVRPGLRSAVRRAEELHRLHLLLHHVHLKTRIRRGYKEPK